MSLSYDGSVIAKTAVIAYHSSPLAEPGKGDAGGMTIYVRELARALARLGVSTDIFTRACDGSPRMASMGHGVRVIGVEAGPQRELSKEELAAHLDEFTTGVRAFAMTQRVRYDVVHSHYWQSGVAAVDVASAWGTPHVHSQHTLGRVKNNSLAPGDEPEPQIRLDGEARVIRAADVQLASTDDEYRQLACLYGAPHDRLKTVHPGVDHDRFHPGDRARARRKLGLSPADAVLLYVGRIQPLKGLELAVRAAAKLVPSLDRKLTFLVVGGASGAGGRQELRRVKQLVTSLDLGEIVRFVGPQRHDLLPDFYRSAEALTVCSHSESFGLAALEAHACGTPVISTAVGGLSHIVRDGASGWLIGERDPSLFATRLRSLLNDDALWRSFSAEAARAAARFSWDATAATLLELYECLARELEPQACTC